MDAERVVADASFPEQRKIIRRVDPGDGAFGAVGTSRALQRLVADIGNTHASATVQGRMLLLDARSVSALERSAGNPISSESEGRD
jgi:hypothetical protein